MNSNLDGFIHFTYNDIVICFSKKNFQGISILKDDNGRCCVVINYYKGSEIRYECLYESTAKEILKKIYTELKK